MTQFPTLASRLSDGVDFPIAMRNNLPRIVLSALVLLFVGCESYRNGSMPQSTATAVTLKENNYKVLKAGARGDSTGFSLLGFIPIVSPNYAEAKASLYSSIGHTIEGRSVALANQTQDTSSVYLILFSIPKIVVTADVVEFIEDDTPETKQPVAVISHERAPSHK